MAGLNGAGALGALARRQYAALAAMRWQMFNNSLRSSRSGIELGARTIGFFMYSFLGLSLGLGMGAGAYALVSRGAWTFLPVLLWVLLGLWQVIPIGLSSLQEQFDISGLLRFPVSFGSFFLLHLVFGLADVSTIMGGLCSFAIWVGITVARPGLFAWAALGLGAFAAFNILLARTIFAWIDRWLAQRRTREIIGALFLVLMLSMQLLNPALRHTARTPHTRRTGTVNSTSRAVGQPTPAAVSAAQRWLPPGLATLALERAAESQPAPALGFLGALGLYLLATGGMLAMRLRAEHRGENLGESQLRKKAAQREGGWRLDGSGPVAAIFEKELHTLMRSMPLLFAIAAPLFMVFVFGGIFRNGATPGHPFPLVLPLCLAYALLGFTQLLYNNLGGEGAGIQLYFLSPTPIRTVLAAKNLFHALVFGLDALLVGVLAGLRLGWPDAAVLAATVAWLLFALPVHLAAGNIFSLTMPYRRNLGRISRQRGSQASALLSLGVQILVLGVGLAVFGLCSRGGRLWLATPVFLAMAGAAAVAWRHGLRATDALANQRRDSLIATLAKTD
jgi:ABC-2 type transport system permease protein